MGVYTCHTSTTVRAAGAAALFGEAGGNVPLHVTAAFSGAAAAAAAAAVALSTTALLLGALEATCTCAWRGDGEFMLLLGRHG
eukprot:1157849-Pelagomonas_calceolata.AAC.6